MIVIDKPVESENVDEAAFRVFVKALELLDGPKKLVEYRNLTWVPSLMAASYAVVLRERGKTLEEIAEFLGSTKQTVQKMLSADPKEVMKKIAGEFDTDDHTAGGIAKEAWRRLKSGEEINLAILPAKNVMEAVGGPAWAVLTLTKLKGVDFPVEGPEILKERLKGIEVDGKEMSEILDRISYPVKSPAELLKKIKEATKT